jgi:large subunit ribosomal protein L24
MHIKKGDNVIVLTGRDKGKKGTVAKVFPKLNRVLIEGVNKVKKHQRARKSGEKGQTIEISLPIHASNVKLS